MSERLQRALLGWAEAESRGGFFERMMSEAAAAGVRFWDVRAAGSGFRFRLPAADYKLLRKPARRCGCRVRLRGKRGLPFLLRRIRFPAALGCGLALAAAELALLGGLVFTVEFSGSSTAPIPETTALLARCGVCVGMRQSAADAEAASHRLLAADPRFSWVSVNLQYGRAEVELADARPAPQLHSDAVGLAAACDCQLTRLYVKSGDALVRIGETVRAGTPLVAPNAGLPQSSWAGTVEAEAWGYVAAEERVTVSKYQVVRTPTGNEAVRRSITLGGLTLPLGSAAVPYRYRDRETAQYPLRAFGVALPALLTVERYREVAQSGRYVDEAGADAVLARLLEALEVERFADARIVRRTARRTDTGDAFVYEVQWLVEREVGEYIY